MRNYGRLFEVKSIRPDPLGKMFVLKISARAVLDTAFRQSDPFHVHVMFSPVCCTRKAAGPFPLRGCLLVYGLP